MNALAGFILAVTLFTEPVEVLVLKSGTRIPIRGDVTLRDDQAVFRSANGTLYSIDASEIDLDASVRATFEVRAPRPRVEPSEPEPAPFARGRALKVSEEEKKRLIADLEKSRATPSARQKKAAPPPPARAYPAETTVEVEDKGDEWEWRRESRRHQENLRQRREELDLLVQKERDLNDRILGFLSLGYRPEQFTLQVRDLEFTRNQIPYAELAVRRAERELNQFMDDARRQGILPGWLR